MPKRRSPTVLMRLRVLAALLLASVAWGSTVEFTHQHGLRTAKASSASEVAISSASQGGTARLQNSNSPLSSSRSGGGAECSLCQLQHNLATTLLSEYVAAVPDEKSASLAQLTSPVHFLEFTATLHGRAPPVSFLS